jgi:hypothetical protein
MRHFFPVLRRNTFYFTVSTTFASLGSKAYRVPKSLLQYFPQNVAGRIVEIATGLRVRWRGVQIPVGTRDFSFLIHVQNGFGANSVSCSVGTGFFP